MKSWPHLQSVDGRPFFSSSRYVNSREKLKWPVNARYSEYPKECGSRRGRGEIASPRLLCNRRSKAGNGGWELALPRSQTRPHLLFSSDNGSVSQASITRAVSLRGTGDICDMDDDVRMDGEVARPRGIYGSDAVSLRRLCVRSVVCFVRKYHRSCRSRLERSVFRRVWKNIRMDVSWLENLPLRGFNECRASHAWILVEITNLTDIAYLNHHDRRGCAGDATRYTHFLGFLLIYLSITNFKHAEQSANDINVMVSTEASWWNILNLKICTTLGYIVSLILLNLGHVFRFRLTMRKRNTCPKFRRISETI